MVGTAPHSMEVAGSIPRPRAFVYRVCMFSFVSGWILTGFSVSLPPTAQKHACNVNLELCFAFGQVGEVTADPRDPELRKNRVSKLDGWTKGCSKFVVRECCVLEASVLTSQGEGVEVCHLSAYLPSCAFSLGRGEGSASESRACENSTHSRH